MYNFNMNTQKGFAPILLILLGLIVLGGGVYLYSQNNKDTRGGGIEDTSLQNKNTSSTTDEILVKDENKPFVSVGDKLGGMTVTSVEPFNSKFSNLSQDNVKIKLSGPITITGIYQHIINAEGFSGFCMSGFDEESIVKLPSLSLIDKTNLFCFRNEDVAKTKLGENQTETKVTVKIDNFELNRYPSEGVDRADLVEVVLDKTETYIDKEHNFRITYPSWENSENEIYKNDSDIFINCPGVKRAGGATCPFGVFVEPTTNRENFISNLLSKSDAQIKTEIKSTEINNIDTISFIYKDNDVLGMETKVTTFLGNKYYVSIISVAEGTIFDEDYNQIINGFKFLSNY